MKRCKDLNNIIAGWEQDRA